MSGLPRRRRARASLRAGPGEPCLPCRSNLMSNPRAPGGLPSWLVVLGSLAVVVHLFAVGVAALTAQSGPWLSPFGPSPVEPPPFASTINDGLGPQYLRPL